MEAELAAIQQQQAETAERLAALKAQRRPRAQRLRSAAQPLRSARRAGA